MEYAPILIPTLNRYEHLMKCLESLSRCTWADQTEVYVALDYPPSEKYVEGWEKNKEFLESCGDMGFKKLHLIEREENYGTRNPGDKGNLNYLCQEVRKHYDRYIVTEDDNVFSPNFLEYMNKGFDKFEDDDSVISLCAFRWWFPIKEEGNTFFRSNASTTPWGVGYWTKKTEKKPVLDYKWFRKHLTIKNLIKVYRNNGPAFVNAFMELSNSDKRHARPVDQHQAIYMTLEDKFQIIPVVSLVRNIGLDGSGVSMPQNNETMKEFYDSIPTSNDNHFEFVGTGWECYEYNKQLYIKERNWQNRKYYAIHFFKKIVRLIKYW